MLRDLSGVGGDAFAPPRPRNSENEVGCRVVRCNRSTVVDDDGPFGGGVGVVVAVDGGVAICQVHQPDAACVAGVPVKGLVPSRQPVGINCGQVHPVPQSGARTVEADDVVAASGHNGHKHERICPGTAEHGVVAGTTVEDVVAGATVDQVVAGVTDKHVVADAAIETVSANSARDGVVAGATKEGEDGCTGRPAIAARDPVVAGATKHGVVAIPGPNRVVAGATMNQICPIARIELIVAGTTIKRVGQLSTIEDIVADASNQVI